MDVLVQILLLSCKVDKFRGKYKKVSAKFEGRHVFRGKKLSLWFINGSWMLGPESNEGTTSGIAFCKDESYSPDEISNESNWSYSQRGGSLALNIKIIHLVTEVFEHMNKEQNKLLLAAIRFSSVREQRKI